MNDVRPALDYDAYVAPCSVTPRPRYRTFDIVVMCTCGVIGGCALLGFLLGALAVVYVSVTPRHEFSGLGLITSLLLAAACLVVATMVLPGAVPPGLRARAYGASAAVFGVISMLTFVALNIFW